MKRGSAIVGMALALILVPLSAQEAPLTGYSAESSRAERQWEEKFRAVPSPDLIRENMKRLSARPHHVGSAYDKENAEWIAGKMKDAGFDVHIETFSVLFPTPRERVVEMVSPTKFSAS